MKNLNWSSLFLVILFYATTWASQDFIGEAINDTREIRALVVDGRLVSESCEKGSCEAIEVLKKKNPTRLKDNANGSDYQHCKDVGGTVLIVSDKKTKNQLGFCEFTDGSFILAWDLFSAAPNLNK